MQRPLIRIFGERNCATRAVSMMVEGVGFRTLPPLGGPRGTPGEAVLQDRIEASFEGQWRQFHLDLLRDAKATRRGALHQWKHAAPVYDPAFAQAQAAVLFLTRNPYSWALSMLRRPYHIRGPRPATLAQLLARPWATLGREGLEPLLPGMMALWVEKALAYQRFEAAAMADRVPVAWLSFEAFVAEPEAATGAALARLGQGGHCPGAVPNTKNDGRSLDDIRAYYARERWREGLTGEDVALINAQVPESLMRALGYACLAPEDVPLGRPPEAAPGGDSPSHGEASAAAAA